MMDQAIVSDDVRRQLKFWLDRLPPFSPVLHRLLATIAMDPDEISLRSLADIVETDTTIAGKVIGIANSGFYSRGQTVCSVHQAVIRLGVNRLRNVLLALSINRVWGGLVIPEGFSILRFNRHGLATAVLCDLLAQRLHPKGAEAAFVAGLFHDVGQLVLVSLYPDDYMPLLHALADGEELEQQERERLPFTHAEMSAEATEHWNLPEVVQNAVRFHERPPLVEGTRSRREFTLAEILHAADLCVTAYGMCVFDSPSKDNAVEEALAPLWLKESEVAEQFLREFEVFSDGGGRPPRLDPPNLESRLAG